VSIPIRTEKLTKRYRETVALDGLDLEVAAGEVLGFLGPNGAGKSTTISLLLGFARPSSGRAEIFGLDCWGASRLTHRRVAYVPSEANLWPGLTGEEVLHVLGNLHGAVDAAHRTELIERFELDVTKKVRAYSHGNRQKVLIVAALATRADVLLLDEPTNGLDPLAEEVFRACVREAGDRGQSVLLSSHMLSEVEAVCDTVVMLRTGRVIERGRLDELRDLSASHVCARFAGPPPAGVDAVPGVTNVTVVDDELQLDVTGPIGPLVRLLADAGVTHLTTSEPSLEELFVTRYQHRS
jgi:ABC-2 type transport system ATP-binding protein